MISSVILPHPSDSLLLIRCEPIRLRVQRVIDSRHDDSAHTVVAVLEGMDRFKVRVPGLQVVQRIERFVGIGQLVLETGNVLWRRRDVVPNADPNASTGTGEIGRVAWRLTRSVTVHTVCSIPECRVYEGTGRNLGGSGRGLPPVG